MPANRLRLFGPGSLVTAAFIGPGTVTVCTLAGVNTGYQLLWALVFSVVATVVLQEMTARIGIVTRQGLGEALRRELSQPALRLFTFAIVLGAIVIGNAAYESGNISGAMLGWNEVLPAWDLTPLLIGAIAGGLLFSGQMRVIRGALGGLVVLMSLVFVAAAILIRPDISAILKGMFIPSAGSGDLLTIAALIGTTVVPYNLFLHASTVQQTYPDAGHLRGMRIESLFTIALGGIVSMAIVITSAGLFGQGIEISSATDMARQLEPVLGAASRYILGIGLFAAGLSSAVTAPLAAAYAANGVLGWNGDLRDWRLRAVWASILAIGVAFSLAGFRPVAVIQFAQVANGILLPVIAVILLVLSNRASLLGSHVNSRLRNALGILVIAVAMLIGGRGIHSVFPFLG